MSHPGQSGSIFGPVGCGVPSPLVPHIHPYPTRYHGSAWIYPDARRLTYQQNSAQVAMPYHRDGWPFPLSAYEETGDSTAPGSGGTQVDQTHNPVYALAALITLGIGAGVGYAVARGTKYEAPMAVAGAVAIGVADIWGLAAIGALGFYLQSKA